MRFIEPGCRQIDFQTLSGVLTVKGEDDLLIMNFPSFSLTPIEITDKIIQAIGIKPVQAFMGADMVCVLESEEKVREMIDAVRTAVKDNQ